MSSGVEQAGLDLYFVDKDGDTFKTTLLHRPYFYLLTRREDENLGQLLLRKFTGSLADAQQVPMTDLDMPNHLSPDHLTRNVWKLLFENVSQLMEVRSELQGMLQTSKRASIAHGSSHQSTVDDLMMLDQTIGGVSSISDPWENLEELREYDVPYHVRVCMDLDIRAGTWYTITLEHQDGGSPLPSPVSYTHLTLPTKRIV